MATINFISNVDDAVDSWFDPLRDKQGANKVFYAASELADWSVAWHLIGAGAALVKPNMEIHSVRLALALGAESAIVNGGLKQLFKRERPPMLKKTELIVRRPKTGSFPSGHSSSATMTAVLLSAAIPKGKPIWWGLAAVVAASRIHNRMHHATDVAAGAVIGTALGQATKRLWPLQK